MQCSTNIRTHLKISSILSQMGVKWKKQACWKADTCIMAVMKLLPGNVLHSSLHINTQHIHININAYKVIHFLTRARRHAESAAPHFCLGKKVITFSPCLSAFKSLSGAIPQWASEIHLNSFWESKQSYCCTLKLWLEREEKIRGRRGRGRLVNKTVGWFYFFSLFCFFFLPLAVSFLFAVVDSFRQATVGRLRRAAHRAAVSLKNAGASQHTFAHLSACSHKTCCHISILH